MGSAQRLVGLLLSLVAAHAARAVDIVWTNTAAGGSWGDATRWNTYPALPTFDGSEDATIGNTVNGGAYALHGDRSVRSLAIQGNKTLTLSAGTPTTSRLTITSGNINRTQYGQYLYIEVPVQIDDGVTPSAAVWYTGGAGGGVFTLSRPIHGLPQSSIQKTSSIQLILQADSSTTFAGAWSIDVGAVRVDHDHGFGAGLVRLRNSANILAGASRTVTNSIELTHTEASIAAANNATFTLTGPVIGVGRLYLGASGNVGAIRLGSPSISATGGVDFFRGCPLVVTGDWTACGNIVLRSTYGGASLQGNGTIGMAASKALTMVRTSAGYYNFIAPGDGAAIFAVGAGTIGTLTLGTPGNGNALTFGQDSRFVVDLSASESDRLVVRGTVNISTAAGTQLRLYGTLGANTTYTLMEYASRDANTFTAVYLNDELVPDPASAQGVGGTHTLVYGDTALQLVGSSSKGTVLLVE